jgi:hypothetical protein
LSAGGDEQSREGAHQAGSGDVKLALKIFTDVIALSEAGMVHEIPDETMGRAATG